jgi:SAM-dependent methyltransferase
VSDDAHYIHGSSSEERARLTTINRLLNDRCLAAAKLRPQERIIDFGAGLGQFSRAMAKATGTRAIGIERNRLQIVEAIAQARIDGEEHLLEMREGDVEKPPLHSDEWGSFDVAHARFILEHVPRPLEVVRAMVKAVKAGGRIILSDDDFDVLRLWPEPVGFSILWDAYRRAYDRRGNDPLIGRRLTQLLHQAGAKPTRNDWIFFGACAGHPDFEGFAYNLIKVLDEARQDISEMGVPPDTVSAAFEALDKWRSLPDASLWHAVSWAEGRTVGS